MWRPPRRRPPPPPFPPGGRGGVGPPAGGPHNPPASGDYFGILIERSRNSFVYTVFTSNGLSSPMYSRTSS